MYKLQNKEQIIGGVAVFSKATPDDIRALAEIAISRSIEEGSFFFLQGEPADFFYILASGKAKLIQTSVDGQQVNLRTLYPGHLFGAVGAVDLGAVYPAEAQALVDCTALAIPAVSFHRMLNERPHLGFGMMRLMTGYIQEMQTRLREMVTEKAEQRIARVLIRLAGHSGTKVEEGVRIELEFSRAELAEMAGTTFFTVSRNLSQWEKQGWIKAGREKITITDPHRLLEFAECD